jgi:hypothetical protein
VVCKETTLYVLRLVVLSVCFLALSDSGNAGFVKRYGYIPLSISCNSHPIELTDAYKIGSSMRLLGTPGPFNRLVV